MKKVYSVIFLIGIIASTEVLANTMGECTQNSNGVYNPEGYASYTISSSGQVTAASYYWNGCYFPLGQKSGSNISAVDISCPSTSCNKN